MCDPITPAITAPPTRSPVISVYEANPTAAKNSTAGIECDSISPGSKPPVMQRPVSIQSGAYVAISSTSNPTLTRSRLAASAAPMCPMYI
jgi:hypothetical protein